MRICFVTDGGVELGLGHILQSTTLAKALESEADVFFLTKSDSTVIERIRKHGFKVSGHESDASILLELHAVKPDVIIFDKLDVSEVLVRDIKRTHQARLVIFTNLTDANRYADVAVLADIGSRFENVRFVDEVTNTLYMYGPKYWVLRPEFGQYGLRTRSDLGTTERILLMFGGSDPSDITSVALEQLLLLDEDFKIDVVLGGHYGHGAKLSEVLRRYEHKRENVCLRSNVSNVAELMFNVQLVIASPGLSAFEALRVGTPVIVVPHDALQRDTYRGFMRMLEREELWRLGEFISKRDYTFPTDKHIAKMEIGEGLHELKDAIFGELARRNRCDG